MVSERYGGTCTWLETTLAVDKTLERAVHINAGRDPDEEKEQANIPSHHSHTPDPRRCKG